jgi:phosphate:Na+ symporter
MTLVNSSIRKGISIACFLLLSLFAFSSETVKVDTLNSAIPAFQVEKLGGEKSYRISGDRQHQVILQPLTKPFSVIVTNKLGKRIEGVTVYFEMAQIPDGSWQYEVMPQVAVTDSLGVAVSYFTLGSVVGEYQVSARIVTTEPHSFVLFTAYARKSNWVTMLVVGLLGGLALFLMGIKLMSSGFKHSAGERIRIILGKLSKNRFYATGFGAFITMVTQSSSATVVMLMGFVQSGLIRFNQTIGMIFGAAIGTTITVQLISFRIADYSLLIIALGFLLNTFSKRESIKFTGEALLGFGILFYGMHIMGEAMSPLRTYDPFVDLLASLKVPILGIIAGTLFTALIQSSAAFIGILLTLASQGLISLEASIPLMMGANLGTSVTGIFAGIEASREAQKVAMGYTMFKFIGILLLAGFITPFVDLVRYITPDIIVDETMGIASNIPRQVANAHTIFNVLITLAVLPFTNIYAKFIDFILPPIQEKKSKYAVKYLDNSLVSTPSVALKVAKQEVVGLCEIVEEMVDEIIVPFISRDKTPLTRIEDRERNVDYLRDQINQYILQITKQDTTDRETQEAFQVMYVVKELEQIADLVSSNLAERSKWWLQSGYEFSAEGKMELKEFHLLTQKQLKRAVAVFTELNLEKAKKAFKKYENFKEVGRELERQHFNRLKKDNDKTLTSSKTHLEMVSVFRTIGSHANNIAQIILEWPGNK